MEYSNHPKYFSICGHRFISYWRVEIRDGEHIPLESLQRWEI